MSSPQSSWKLVYKKIKVLKQDPDIYNYKLFDECVVLYMKLNPIFKLGGKKFELKKECPDCSMKDIPRQERSTIDTHHGQRIVGSSSIAAQRQSKSYDKKDQQQIPIMDKELLVLHQLQHER